MTPARKVFVAKSKKPHRIPSTKYDRWDVNVPLQIAIVETLAKSGKSMTKKEVYTKLGRNKDAPILSLAALLEQAGLVIRNTDSKPFTFSLTAAGRAAAKDPKHAAIGKPPATVAPGATFNDAAEPPELIANDIDAPSIERVATTTFRILRDTSLARQIKRIHNHKCQICGFSIELPDGSRYAEAHHIRPLGTPHDGPDIEGNILVLCPNHHSMCDYAAMKLDLDQLRTHAGHAISEEFINYHNSLVQ
jgi:HNH endonuclease